jgi:hypothetical protein
MVVDMTVRRFLLASALALCAAPFGWARAQQPDAKARAFVHRDPQLATILGVLIPGGGQFYAGRWGKGLALFGGAAVGVGLAIDANQNACPHGGTCGYDAVKAGGIIAAAALWGVGWWTAAADARLYNTQMLRGVTFSPFLDRHNGQMVAGLTLTR